MIERRCARVCVRLEAYRVTYITRITVHIVKIRFSVFSPTEGANGDGMAVISSLRSFDREQQKEYLIPIVIKDSGNPAMTGTSTLTVIIRDVNDNKMQPGSKEIFAYNYMVSTPCWSTGHERIIVTKCRPPKRRVNVRRTVVGVLDQSKHKIRLSDIYKYTAIKRVNRNRFCWLGRVVLLSI